MAIADGFRESKASWRDVLPGLKARGLQSGPLLAVGYGAMGFWAALEEVFPATRAQRCWFHQLGNVLNALPASQQAKAKAAMQDIFMAATRVEAVAAFERFMTVYGAKYPKAVEKLTQDADSLLAFYDFPAEHWQHIRTTNPIESTCATVRHRTTRARNCLSRATFLGLAFKLMEEAEKTGRKIRGADKIGRCSTACRSRMECRRKTIRRNNKNSPPDNLTLQNRHTPDLTLALIASRGNGRV